MPRASKSSRSPSAPAKAAKTKKATSPAAGRVTKAATGKSAPGKSAGKPTAGKSTAGKSTAGKSAASKSTAARSTRKATPARSAVKPTAAKPAADRSTATRSTAVRSASPRSTTAKPSATSKRHPPGGGKGGSKAPRRQFLAAQKDRLIEERRNYTRQAEELKAQADSLALEHEPGDVQFDEEGGEGGTSNVDRELDLVLSAQARGAVAEIDRALAKIEGGTYGECERCGASIPDARLEALPHAALCVACKSGGLSSRR
jgi:DnaK suppressor protein